MAQPMANRQFVGVGQPLFSQFYDFGHESLALLVQHDVAILAKQVGLSVSRDGKKSGMHSDYVALAIHFHVPNVEFFQNRPVLVFTLLQSFDLLQHHLMTLQVFLKQCQQA